MNIAVAKGPHPDGPYDMAYDTQRQALILLAWENGKSVVWEWQNNQWQKIPCSGNYPTVRNRYMLSYYPDDGVTYLFGGFIEDQQLGDFWRWNGQQWTEMHPDESPSQRNSAHFAYTGDQLLLYGGSVPKPGEPGHLTLCNELWAWRKGHWKRLQ